MRRSALIWGFALLSIAAWSQPVQGAATTKSWFDPESFYILNGRGQPAKHWHDGDTVKPGVVLDLNQWAIFDTPNEEYSVVFGFDAWGNGAHWNTRHLIRTYDPASAPLASLTGDGRPVMYVPINTAVKVGGGYQSVPNPKPGSGGRKLTATFTASVHQNNEPLRGATTTVTFKVASPTRTDHATGFKVAPGVFGWRWKDSSGAVIAHNEGYPDRSSAKQAALAVAGSDCPYSFR